MRTPVPRRRARLATIAGIGALLTSALVPLAPTAAAATGHMTPAVGTSPHLQYVGNPAPDAALLSCQKTTPATCYGPDQIRAAYGVQQLAHLGLDGRGQSIVIVDAYQSPSLRADLAAFESTFGLPAATLNIVAPQGLPAWDANDELQTGWAGEITLDVEWSHAIAPAATINLVLAKSSDDADILAATRYAVEHNLGSVISQSFGEAEQCMDPALLRAQHQLFAEATRKRITLIASAGDQGAAQPTCDGTGYFKAASTPASDPNVTGIGGTILDADGTTGAYHAETTWNEPTYGAAGGGGYSVLYREPGYQWVAQRSGKRAVPDVSYNAAIIGGVLAVYSPTGDPAEGQHIYRFGGTSAGSPQWAGLVALANQLRHGRIGFMNDTLYLLSVSKRMYATMFNDVTTGDNSLMSVAGDGTTSVVVKGFSATRGWDAATGLGTPRAQFLVPALAFGG
jgi:subtilase family serine protease